MTFKKFILLLFVPLVILHTNGMVLHIHQCVKHICEQACCESESSQEMACCAPVESLDESGCCKNEKKYVKASSNQVIDFQKKLNLELNPPLDFSVTSYINFPTLSCVVIPVKKSGILLTADPPGPATFRSVLQIWNC